jgi:hypothetical protein
VRENQIIPAMQGDQPITGCKIDPGLPFGRADLILDGGIDGADGIGDGLGDIHDRRSSAVILL